MFRAISKWMSGCKSNTQTSFRTKPVSAFTNCVSYACSFKSHDLQLHTRFNSFFWGCSSAPWIEGAKLKKRNHSFKFQDFPPILFLLSQTVFSGYQCELFTFHDLHLCFPIKKISWRKRSKFKGKLFWYKGQYKVCGSKW